MDLFLVKHNFLLYLQIFTVDTSSEGKEARVRLLNSYANQNAALPSVSVQQVPMQLQKQQKTQISQLYNVHLH